jgi:hypothetical protein
MMLYWSEQRTFGYGGRHGKPLVSESVDTKGLVLFYSNFQIIRLLASELRNMSQTVIRFPTRAMRDERANLDIYDNKDAQLFLKITICGVVIQAGCVFDF